MDRTTHLSARAVLGSALVVMFLAMGVERVASADSVPYTDPNAFGFIGLCDTSDHAVDHGNVADQPFVRSAVASEAAVAPYDVGGRTATLFAYQPRQGTTPQEWSGQLLTASSSYTDVQHPTAVATAGDDSLASFIASFPPQWDGLIQLRLYLGAPGQPARTGQYAATDIQVSGSTWKVVRGGTTPCDASKSTSLEDLVPGGSVSSAVPATGPAVTTTADHVAPDTGASGGGSSTGGRLALAGAGVVIVAVAFVVYDRRRRARSTR
ncbi:MAG: hypothetical protein JWM34_2862 [Ilumatobacteraceae bacterium]|nr:hypothetical protein [Ilumatobacteraceae bacterium]